MRTAIAFLALAVLLAAQTPRYPIQGSSGGGGGGATIASTTLLIKGDNAGNGIAAGGTDVCALLTLTGDVTSSAACATVIANAAVTAIKMVNAGVHTGDCITTFPNCTITAGAITAAKMVNGGVFTGDATTTFPALTIGNGAITAVKMVNAGVHTGDCTTTFPNCTITAAAITAAKMVNGGVFTGDATTTFPALTIGAGAITNSKIANSTIDLTAKVTGVLPVANGGTVAQASNACGTSDLCVSGSLSQAQIVSLTSTAGSWINVIAAPAAGSTIIVDQFIAEAAYNGTAYAGGSAFGLNYGTAATQATSTCPAATLTQANKNICFQNSTVTAQQNITVYSGVALNIGIVGASWTCASTCGSLYYWIKYRIVTGLQ